MGKIKTTLNKKEVIGLLEEAVRSHYLTTHLFKIGLSPDNYAGNHRHFAGLLGINVTDENCDEVYSILETVSLKKKMGFNDRAKLLYKGYRKYAKKHNRI